MEGQDARVVAIRADERVGHGSCSSIDECFEDRELVERLNAEGVKIAKAAVAWAVRLEGLWLDKGADASSGEADCPLVAAARAWRGEPAEPAVAKVAPIDDDDCPVGYRHGPRFYDPIEGWTCNFEPIPGWVDPGAAAREAVREARRDADRTAYEACEEIPF